MTPPDVGLPEALERAASALEADADAIRPANGDPSSVQIVRYFAVLFGARRRAMSPPSGALAHPSPRGNLITAGSERNSLR